MLLTPEELNGLGLTEQPWDVITGQIRRQEAKKPRSQEAKEQDQITSMKTIPTAKELETLRTSHLSRVSFEDDLVKAMQTVLDHLQPWLKPAGLPWVSLHERKPAREDADRNGELIFSNGESWCSAPWNASLGSSTHFMSFQPPVQPDLDREAFDKMAAERDWNITRHPSGGYLSDATQERYEGFKAARELARKEKA